MFDVPPHEWNEQTILINSLFIIIHEIVLNRNLKSIEDYWFNINYFIWDPKNENWKDCYLIDNRL